ncbi:BMC domain-containing protein [Paenibacillus sp. ISL-20]|uniref:BMC domain-containing protein n=1 Tax=Paenibacillus sp. ISL-20 TaxID=2819163 RepID=UPI001BEA86F4|nr:BMC domain-containing protein [Paenibacillus sp. ISL-20]MBT2760575.1 BMC domain-containing protein [Paenibacillus sp. ISL-20]
MRYSALGLVEVRGFLGAVAAADAALKAASVTCIGMEIIGGGLVTVKLDGDVGAVQAAVSAGAEMAKQLNVLLTRHVIARMHEETAVLVEEQDDTGESPLQAVATMDEQEQKQTAEAAEDGVEQIAAPNDAANKAIHLAIQETVASKDLAEERASSEDLKAADTAWPQALKTDEANAVGSQPERKPSPMKKIQTQAEEISTPDVKETEDAKAAVKLVPEQKDADKAATPDKKHADAPKSKHNDGKPREQPKQKSAAKSGKKSKKASS